MGRAMDLAFRTKKMAKTANSWKKLQKAHGRNAQKILLRLQQLDAAPCLADVRELDPLARLHQLSADRDEQFAVEVSGNYRLIFEVANVPVPKKEDDENAIDETHVTSIRVLELCEDYHG